MKKLKKILLRFQDFMHIIFSKIDKYVVVPITKFFLYISETLENNSKTIEKILVKKNTLIFISLFFAVGIFLLVDSKTVVLVETSAEVLYNQPVSAIYNEENYVIEGLPKTVDVTLIGRRSDLYFAKQLPTKDITIDLSNLKPGTHTVSLKYKQSLTSIDYKLDPSEALIVVYPKKSASKTIQTDILNQDKLDPRLNIKSVSLDREEVIIKGAEHVLKRVATVKALIDIEKLPNQVVGDLVLKDVSLVAYDVYGNVVDVEIVPDKVNVTLTIDSPSKEVALKIIPKGTLTLGKAISSLESSLNTVTIYGNIEALNDINFLPVEINVDNIKDSKEYNIVLERPSGVTYLSSSTVNIKMTIGEEVQKEIENIFIEHINLGKEYNVKAIDEESVKTTVILKGVQSIIDNIDPSSIKATVDLNGLGAGDHEVDIIIEGNDLRVNYATKIKAVKLRIYKS